jgi:hypothetical protein
MQIVKDFDVDTTAHFTWPKIHCSEVAPHLFAGNPNAYRTSNTQLAISIESPTDHAPINIECASVLGSSS